MAKKIVIGCSNCGGLITMSASDPCIVFYSRAGVSRLEITVHCHHCGNDSFVPENPETHSLLDERIKNKDYDDKIVSDPLDEMLWD